MTTQRDGTGPQDAIVHLEISVSRLPRDGQTIHFVASAQQRAALARRFDLQDLTRFEAEIVASRWQADGVMIEGTLTADVVQTDVVTLDPIAQSVADDVRLFFVPEHSRLAPQELDDAGELDVDPAEDAPETFRGDRIDLGDALVQFFGLALDPYPRAEGVAFEEVREGEKEPSPFAVLGRLRDKSS